MIQLWGAAPKSKFKKVQVILNKSARFILGRNKRTPTKELMKECGWLQIEDMVTYHSLVSMWNSVHRRIPTQLFDKLTIDNNMRIQTEAPRLLTVAHGYRHRTVAKWNQLDDNTRNMLSLPKFKKAVKTQLKEQRNHE